MHSEAQQEADRRYERFMPKMRVPRWLLEEIHRLAEEQGVPAYMIVQRAVMKPN